MGIDNIYAGVYILRMKNITLNQLMDQQTPGGKGLLAAELLAKTDRRDGPVDGHCEICGEAAASFILQDWLHWHCQECVVRVVRAEFAAQFSMAVAA